MAAPLARSLVASSSRILPRAAPLRSFSSACPRLSQHETTETPARAHRRENATQRNNAGPQSADPAAQAAQDTANDHLSALRDLASSFQPNGVAAAKASQSAPGAAPSSAASSSSSSSSADATSSSAAFWSKAAPATALAMTGYTPDSLPAKSDETVLAFVNLLMKDGKKPKAQRQVLGMLREMSQVLNSDPLPALTHAIELAAPMVRMQSRKGGGGKILQVPVIMTPKQMRRKAITGIIKASKNRGGRTLEKRLANEVIGILEGESETLKTKAAAHMDAVRNRSNLNTRV